MKYAIMCGGEYATFKEPKQLLQIHGEALVDRTIRLLRENGVEEGVNGFYLDFDMRKADADFCAKLYKGVKKFTYTPIEDRWREWLVPGGRNYQDELNEMVDVECVREYFDMQLKRMVYPPEVITVNRPRAEQICEASYGRMKQ